MKCFKLVEKLKTWKSITIWLRMANWNFQKIIVLVKLRISVGWDFCRVKDELLGNMLSLDPSGWAQVKWNALSLSILPCLTKKKVTRKTNQNIGIGLKNQTILNRFESVTNISSPMNSCNNVIWAQLNSKLRNASFMIAMQIGSKLCNTV